MLSRLSPVGGPAGRTSSKHQAPATREKFVESRSWSRVRLGENRQSPCASCTSFNRRDELKGPPHPRSPLHHLRNGVRDAQRCSVNPAVLAAPCQPPMRGLSLSEQHFLKYKEYAPQTCVSASCRLYTHAGSRAYPPIPRHTHTHTHQVDTGKRDGMVLAGRGGKRMQNREVRE